MIDWFLFGFAFVAGGFVAFGLVCLVVAIAGALFGDGGILRR